MALIDYEDYLSAGLSIFPLHPILPGGYCGCGNPECKNAGKHPRQSNWQHVTTWDDDQLEFLSGQFVEGFGVNCKELLVVDVDPRNGGYDSFQALNDAVGITAACQFAVETGGGGWHYYFKAPDDVALKYKVDDYPGIEFKSSGFVVGCGSQHASGERYSVEHGAPKNIDSAPDALINLLHRPERAARANRTATETELAGLLDAIPNNGNDDYDTWLAVGMAVHAGSESSDEGYALWVEWSAQSTKFDEHEMPNKWRSFDNKPEHPVTVATLVHLARKHGFVDPVSFECHDFDTASLDDLFAPKKRNEFVEVSELLMQTSIGQYAESMSLALEIPVGSVFSVMLGCAGGIAATNYSTCFGSGDRVPLGVYVAAEQPPSVQKSRIVNSSTSAFLERVAKHNKRISENNADMGQDDAKLPFASSIVTDPTTAGLDNKLAKSDSGRAFIATAEQSAFQSLFPDSGNYSSNNALLLNGWMGEFIAGERTGRKAFTGHAQLAVAMFAQRGSVERVLGESNQTGLAERFIFLSEPDSLGHRTFPQVSVNDARYNIAVAGIMGRWSARVRFVNGDPVAETDVSVLDLVQPDDEGRRLIRDARINIEVTLGQLKNSGEYTYIGWLGKIETHVLKIAAILHVFDAHASGGEVSDTIPAYLINETIKFVVSLGQHMRYLIQDAGDAGETAEADVIVDIISGAQLTPSEVARAARRRAPFKAHGARESYSVAKSAVDRMLESGMLTVNTAGKKNYVISTN